MPEPQVLIVGAGPTGLLLALWLTRRGIRVRIIDKVDEPGTTSRALVVHARTLEFYRQLGIAEEVVRRGREFVAANLWVQGRRAGRAAFGQMGKGLSPFPYMLIYPQDEHERLLIEHLSKLGVTVERPVEFIGHEIRDGRIFARLRGPSGAEETCTADYLAGCDGARSAVREAIEIGFPGGTYEHMFYVADVTATGPVMNGELHIALDEADFLAVFPLHDNDRARLVGIVRSDMVENMDELSWQDVSKTVIGWLGIQVDRVHWFSTYHVHHRVAEHFQKGRVFLLGDAAHIHSPVGGQGMNTGLGDAVNLAWKLADVLHDRAAPKLLDTFEPERIAFARRLIASTDRAFTFVTSPGRFARFVRTTLAPRILPLLFRSKAFRRLQFRIVSQIAINYRHSSLSRGETRRLKSGDRLPWVAPPSSTTGDNFTPLESLDWQVHIYGDCDPTIQEFCQQRNLPLHTFEWSNQAATAGFTKAALYLIRPDGYIGFVDPAPSVHSLDSYLSSLKLGSFYK
jgi:2-polyprenyl-6-methoxyphenol hydroxylase-like FAD-dependent oxidoreductase